MAGRKVLHLPEAGGSITQTNRAGGRRHFPPFPHTSSTMSGKNEGPAIGIDLGTTYSVSAAGQA